MSVVLLMLIAVRPWESTHAWNPWSPLTLEHEINPVSRRKLSRLSGDPDVCLDTLQTAPQDYLDYMPLADYLPEAGCPLANVVRVRHTGVAFNTPFTVTCPLLVRWTMFERQRLQSLASQYLGSPVETIEHYGSFSCRNIYNRESARRSEHATASAFDIAAFTLENGETVTVLDDWDNDDESGRKAFLRAVHAAACDYFGTVLGPDYNAQHNNHFHLDTRRFGPCR